MHIGRVFLKSTEVDFVHFIAANLFAEAPFSMSDLLAISIPQIPTPDRRSVARMRPLPVILYDRRTDADAYWGGCF